MKTYLLSLLVSILCLTGIFAQNGENNVIQFYEIMKSRNAGKPLELNGSEFLYDEWLPMKIFMEDGREFEVAHARINLLGGSVDVMYKEREMELMLTFINKLEVMHEGRLKSISPIFRINAKDLPEKGFVEVIPVDNVLVLKRYHKYVIKADPNAKILGVDPRPKVLIKNDTYIIKNKTAFEISSKKDLKKVYKNKYKELEMMIEEGNIDVKNPVALAAILKKLNSDTVN